MAAIVWIGNFLTSVIAWLGARYSERIALTIALLGAFAVIWATFSTAVWSLIVGITLSLPSNLQVFYFMLPDSLPALMTARVSVDLAAASFAYARENIKLKSYIT